MAGITEKGFEKKSFTEILEDMTTEARNIFGDDVDLRDETFLKQWLVTSALKEAERWDILEDVYNNFSVSTATNVSLDYAVKFQGMRRKQATKAEVDVVFIGDNGTIINSGFIVGTSNGVKFETLTSDTIEAGSVIIPCRALLSGADGNVPADTITEIESPLLGLSEVENLSEATGGLEIETDESLRIRYLESLARGGGSTANAIRAAILTLDTVLDAMIFENETDSIQDGIDPHSFVSYVLGGDPTEIQESIFTVKSLGIQAQGSITGTFTTESNTSVTIGFERPTEIDVWVNIDVTTDGDYPIDGDDQVKEAVRDYIDTLRIGDDVIIFGMGTYIANRVTGLTNIVIQTSTDGTTFSQSDITIYSDLTNGVQSSTTSLDKIEVV